MDEGPISKLAYAGRRPESALPHEWLLWYRLRDIYADVRAGRMVKQVGQAMDAHIGGSGLLINLFAL